MSGNTSETGGVLDPAATPVVVEDPDLSDFLATLIYTITGLDENNVRPRWQTTPPNQLPRETDWCAVGIMAREPQAGTPSIVHDGAGDAGEGIDELQRTETLSLLATFYGPNAAALAERLADGLWVPQNNETLLLAEMALIDVGQVITTSEPIGGAYLQRFDIDFSIRRLRRRVYPVRNIADAPFTITEDSQE